MDNRIRNPDWETDEDLKSDIQKWPSLRYDNSG